MTSLRRPSCLPSDKDHGISPETETRASPLRRGLGCLSSDRHQGGCCHIKTRAASLRQRPGHLSSVSRVSPPVTVTRATLGRESKGLLSKDRDQGISLQSGARATSLRKGPACLSSDRHQGNFYHIKTRAPPSGRVLGASFQTESCVSPLR